MQSDIPQNVGAHGGFFRCVRLLDGRFHLVKPGPIPRLLFGGDYILASESLAELLHDLCAHCVDLRRTEIVQIATGETFGTYFEVIPHDKITPENISKVSTAGFHAWRFGSKHLFVTPVVAEEIRKRGFSEVTFSEGFSHFAVGEV